MAHTDSSPGAGAALPASDKSIEQATLIGTLVHLWPYIWPSDRADLKMRVVWSMVLLLIAKLTTLAVPFTFKWAIDALTGADTAPVQSSNWKMWLIASPLIMTVSYGGMRVLMAV
nr:metal ABC transporter permease [Bradyrhizobium sp.]